MQLAKQFSISELVVAADGLIEERRAQYENIEPIETPRNVHFYVKQGLLQPPEGRGPKTVYSQEALYRLVFVRILQSTTPFGLREIRQFMEDRQEKQIADIAMGTENFEVKTWPHVARLSMSKDTGVERAPTDTEAKQFGELSAKFAAMAHDFAKTAADFAQMAESYSRKRKF